MTAILCNWLNDDVQLSKKVDIINFSREFSSGYLLGEVLHKYQLQDDFDQFSQTTTADARLHNFTRLEPSLHRLGLRFDTNTARDIMTEKAGSATNLMYQLYITLNNKRKFNLTTSVTLETMMPAAPTRFYQTENPYLKQMMSRQPNPMLSTVTDPLHNKRIEMEKIAFKERFLSEERIKMQKQKEWETFLEKSQQLQGEQIEQIRSSKVNVVKPLPNRTIQALVAHRQERKQQEAQEVLKDIERFDHKLKTKIKGGLQTQTSNFMQANDGYINELHKRFKENKCARAEREKRKRKFIVDQQRAQDSQWLAHRDEVLTKRGLRQTQQERKIVVQLLQTRLQKNVILNNKIIREKQYERQREKDFLNAMNREAELLQFAKEQYKDQIQKDIALHERIKAERKAKKYQKHYEMCSAIVLQITDFACKICDERATSNESLIKQKLMREWKTLFISGQPLYEAPIETAGGGGEGEDLPEPDHVINEATLQLMDEEDFKEYKDMLYEWMLPEDAIKSKDNAVIGHIIARLLSILNPPTPPPKDPVFPKFSIRGCILGKIFCGKTSIVSKLIQDYNVTAPNADEVIKECVEAYENRTQEMESSGELSNKASLGQKICECLKQGKAVDDELLVEAITDEIRNIPEGIGWILDGFPVTYTQTKALEKALSGIDAAKVGFEPLPQEEVAVSKFDPKNKKLKKSNLFLDPQPKPLPPEPNSGLDIIILLDLPDDVCLKRAAGRYELIETGERYHIHFNPPPLKDVSNKKTPQNVVPLKTEAFDEENAQSRLMTHLDNWPGMEKWFERFGNLHKIDANQDINSIYEEIKSLLKEVIEAKEAKEKAAEEKAIAEVINEITETISAADEIAAKILRDAEEEKEREKEAANVKATKGKGAKQNSASPKNEKNKKGSASPKNEKNKKDSASPKNEKRKKGKSPHAESEREAEILLVPSPPVILPGSAEWEYVATDIDMEMATNLASFWESIENTYVDNCKKMLRNIRSERNSIKPYFQDIKFIFLEYLKRPDNKQDFINQWQKEYNDISDDIRFDQQTQRESHQMVDDLKEKLWNICDEQKQQAEAEWQAIMNNGWYDDLLGKLCNSYITLMQIEIDRFQNTIYLLRDYYKISDQQIPPQPNLNYSRLPLIEIINTKLEILEGTPQKEIGNYDGKRLTPKKKPGTPDSFMETESIGSHGTKGSLEPKTPVEREKSSVLKQTSKSPPTKSAKKGKEKEKEKEENKRYELVDAETLGVRLKIPLITPTSSRYLSPDGTSRVDAKKCLKELGTDIADKEILDIYQSVFEHALNEVVNLINAEHTAREIEEEEERLKELEKENNKSITADKGKKGTKNKKQSASASSKKGKKEEATPTPTKEISEEERIRQEMKKKIKQEFYFALEQEEASIKSRLQLIRRHSLEYILKELHTTANNTHKPMHDWIGAKFLRQMESIDQMTEVMRNAIENGQKLKNELRLPQEDFYIDKACKVTMSPTPPPPQCFAEDRCEQLTRDQLTAFFIHFCDTAPFGIMDSKYFQETLSDLLYNAEVSDAVPNLWMSNTLQQIQQNIPLIVKQLTSDTGCIDWRQFLLCAIYPFVEFSEESLYRLFVSYFEVDTEKTGFIQFEQYDSIELWTDEEAMKQNDVYGYDRSDMLRKFFFHLFSEVGSDPLKVNYEKMLLYFCASSSLNHGFIRALSLASMAHMMRNGEPVNITDNRLPIRIPQEPECETSPRELLKSRQSEYSRSSVDTLSQMMEAIGDDSKENDYIKTALDQMIPIEALFKILHHGKVSEDYFNEMKEKNSDAVDLASMESLASVYTQLGSKDGAPVHYSILIEHSLIKVLMKRSQFLLMDIKCFG